MFVIIMAIEFRQCYYVLLKMIKYIIYDYCSRDCQVQVIGNIADS